MITHSDSIRNALAIPCRVPVIIRDADIAFHNRHGSLKSQFQHEKHRFKPNLGQSRHLCFCFLAVAEVRDPATCNANRLFD